MEDRRRLRQVERGSQAEFRQLLSKKPSGGNTDKSDCRSCWQVHEVVPPDAKGGHDQKHIERDQNCQRPAVMAHRVNEQDRERRMEGRKADDALDVRKI